MMLLAMIAALLGGGVHSAHVPLQRLAPVRTGTVVVAAAGDIACDPFGVIDSMSARLLGWCRMADTARLIEAHHVTAVLALGDEQYQSARPDDFAYGYALTWGALTNITYPTPGNHEYYTPLAA